MLTRVKIQIIYNFNSANLVVQKKKKIEWISCVLPINDNRHLKLIPCSYVLHI